MRGKLTLYVDQHGLLYYARNVRQLRSVVGGGRINKMYVDTKDGHVLHIGYVVGKHWLTAYQRVELKAR